MNKNTLHFFNYLRDALVVASAYAERNIETFEEKHVTKVQTKCNIDDQNSERHA